MIYKPEDITASMLRESFPQVVADLQDEPEITAESLRASHPELVASFTAEGVASANTDEAVTAERERVVAIQALSRPGVESIITDALADSNETVSTVKVKLYDHDEKVRTDAGDSHREDGKKLADKLAGISGQGGEDEADEKTAKEASHKRMLAKAKGEK